jgi:hypothetical protein
LISGSLADLLWMMMVDDDVVDVVVSDDERG